jgi:hypothetical protein
VCACGASKTIECADRTSINLNDWS